MAVGDLNGDGWSDLVAACEETHLAYFQNPGKDARTAKWPSLVPSVTRGRGSWLKVDIADFTGTGRNQNVAANKGVADVVRTDDLDQSVHPTALFVLRGDPLRDPIWQEQPLVQDGVPNQARAIDINADGAIDVIAASRLDPRILLVKNEGPTATGVPAFTVLPVTIPPSGLDSTKLGVVSNAFDVVFGDIDRDGRTDLVVNVLEFVGATVSGWQSAGPGWLAQPESLDQPWMFHRIGTILPDWTTGLGLADIDGDGDLDLVVGGYLRLFRSSGVVHAFDHAVPGAAPRRGPCRSGHCATLRRAVNRRGSRARRDKRIEFVGGSRGVGALQAPVDQDGMAAAFALYPTQMADLMALADAGQVMPPKSTWFDPKLADRMVSHVID